MHPDTARDLKELYVLAAQTRYDYWQQDEDGIDPELGTGGICSEIADEAVCYYQEAGYDAWATGNDDHAWVTIEVQGKKYEIDIPCSIYEIGSVYTWTKIPDVIFTIADVCIWESPETELEMTNN